MMPRNQQRRKEREKEKKFFFLRIKRAIKKRQWKWCHFIPIYDINKTTNKRACHDCMAWVATLMTVPLPCKVHTQNRIFSFFFFVRFTLTICLSVNCYCFSIDYNARYFYINTWIAKSSECNNSQLCRMEVIACNWWDVNWFMFFFVGDIFPCNGFAWDI